MSNCIRNLKRALTFVLVFVMTMLSERLRNGWAKTLPRTRLARLSPSAAAKRQGRLS